MAKGGNASISERLWSLHFLKGLCRNQAAVSSRLSDLLDIKYLDTIILIRAMDRQSINSIIDSWTMNPNGAALPGLVWALCSDERKFARLAGLCLTSSATWVGCQQLVEVKTFT